MNDNSPQPSKNGSIDSPLVAVMSRRNRLETFKKKSFRASTLAVETGSVTESQEEPPSTSPRMAVVQPKRSLSAGRSFQRSNSSYQKYNNILSSRHAQRRASISSSQQPEVEPLKSDVTASENPIPALSVGQESARPLRRNAKSALRTKSATGLSIKTALKVSSTQKAGQISELTKPIPSGLNECTTDLATYETGLTTLRRSALSNRARKHISSRKISSQDSLSRSVSDKKPESTTGEVVDDSGKKTEAAGVDPTISAENDVGSISQSRNGYDVQKNDKAKAIEMLKKAHKYNRQSTSLGKKEAKKVESSDIAGVSKDDASLHLPGSTHHDSGIETSIDTRERFGRKVKKFKSLQARTGTLNNAANFAKNAHDDTKFQADSEPDEKKDDAEPAIKEISRHTDSSSKRNKLFIKLAANASSSRSSGVLEAPHPQLSIAAASESVENSSMEAVHPVEKVSKLRMLATRRKSSISGKGVSKSCIVYMREPIVNDLLTSNNDLPENTKPTCDQREESHLVVDDQDNDDSTDNCVEWKTPLNSENANEEEVEDTLISRTDQTRIILSSNGSILGHVSQTPSTIPVRDHVVEKDKLDTTASTVLLDVDRLSNASSKSEHEDPMLAKSGNDQALLKSSKNNTSPSKQQTDIAECEPAKSYLYETKHLVAGTGMNNAQIVATTAGRYTDDSFVTTTGEDKDETGKDVKCGVAGLSEDANSEQPKLSKTSSDAQLSYLDELQHAASSALLDDIRVTQGEEVASVSVAFKDNIVVLKEKVCLELLSVTSVRVVPEENLDCNLSNDLVNDLRQAKSDKLSPSKAVSDTDSYEACECSIGAKSPLLCLPEITTPPALPTSSETLHLLAETSSVSDENQTLVTNVEDHLIATTSGDSSKCDKRDNDGMINSLCIDCATAGTPKQKNNWHDATPCINSSLLSVNSSIDLHMAQIESDDTAFYRDMARSESIDDDCFEEFQHGLTSESAGLSLDPYSSAMEIIKFSEGDIVHLIRENNKEQQLLADKHLISFKERSTKNPPSAYIEYSMDPEEENKKPDPDGQQQGNDLMYVRNKVRSDPITEYTAIGSLFDSESWVGSDSTFSMAVFRKEPNFSQNSGFYTSHSSVLLAPCPVTRMSGHHMAGPQGGDCANISEPKRNAELSRHNGELQQINVQNTDALNLLASSHCQLQPQPSSFSPKSDFRSRTLSQSGAENKITSYNGITFPLPPPPPPPPGSKKKRRSKVLVKGSTPRDDAKHQSTKSKQDKIYINSHPALSNTPLVSDPVYKEGETKGYTVGKPKASFNKSTGPTLTTQLTEQNSALSPASSHAVMSTTSFADKVNQTVSKSDSTIWGSVQMADSTETALSREAPGSGLASSNGEGFRDVQSNENLPLYLCKSNVSEKYPLDSDLMLWLVKIVLQEEIAENEIALPFDEKSLRCIGNGVSFNKVCDFLYKSAKRSCPSMEISRFQILDFKELLESNRSKFVSFLRSVAHACSIQPPFHRGVGAVSSCLDTNTDTVEQKRLYIKSLLLLSLITAEDFVRFTYSASMSKRSKADKSYGKKGNTVGSVTSNGKRTFDKQKSPFELVVRSDPLLLAYILGCLGDPVAVCRMKQSCRTCHTIIDENEHVLIRDAVRLGGLPMNLRPAFWLWVTLEKIDHDFKGDLQHGFEELKKEGLEGKWHHTIERDVARSFGHFPPHKSGAHRRSDSIVRALVTWGRSRTLKRGVKGSRDPSALIAETDYEDDKSLEHNDAVSDWGGVTPVGSFASSVGSGRDEFDDARNCPSPSLSPPAANGLERGLASFSSNDELTLGCNALTVEVKKALQDKLRVVLHALAAAHPDVGYCQGMDYVVAHLLRILQDTVRWKAATQTLPPIISSAPQDLSLIEKSDVNTLLFEVDKTEVVEEACFHVMNTFFNMYGLKHFYWPELRCLKTCCLVFEKLVKIKLPVLADHFEHHELNVGLFALGWFQTLFLYLPSMPSATVCHMWDIWLVERSFKIFFRVGVAILFLSQPILLNQELEGMMGYLNTFPDSTLLSPDILIACALQIKVTNKVLAEIEGQLSQGKV